MLKSAERMMGAPRLRHRAIARASCHYPPLGATIRTGYEDDVSEGKTEARDRLCSCRVDFTSRSNIRAGGSAARIRAIAAAQGIELIGIVEDRGKSALDMNREGLNAILAATAARRFDVVIVEDWARLARDPDDLQHILDSLAADGVIVVYGA